MEPPAELITRIAYLAPAGASPRALRTRNGIRAVEAPVADSPPATPPGHGGMAMTVLSFAMLERCSGIHVQHLQPADLNPVRVWGGVEDKALRVKDQVVKYYDNLRVVYEIESHLKDLEDPQTPATSAKAATSVKPSKTAKDSSQSQGKQP